MMQRPVQAPPQPRPFMQLIVSRAWKPSPEEGENVEPELGRDRQRDKQRPHNSCLLQLTTFAIRSLHR